MTIGERLKKLRESYDLSQKEVASILGLSYSGYNCYENDIRIPTIENIIKLAELYNVTTDYILGIEKKYLTIKEVLRRVNELEKQIKDFKNFIENF